MNETLNNIIDNHRLGLLSTRRIQVSGKLFSDEIINFPEKQIKDLFLYSSTFKNSHFINMKFLNVNFESSFFEKCVIENCTFKNNIFPSAVFKNCVFINCFLIDCMLSDVDFEETTFKECTVLNESTNNSVFESCHFVKTIFKSFESGYLNLGCAVLINSTFSNSKKSINFDDVYLTEVLDQINNLELD